MNNIVYELPALNGIFILIPGPHRCAIPVLCTLQSLRTWTHFTNHKSETKNCQQIQTTKQNNNKNVNKTLSQIPISKMYELRKEFKYCNVSHWYIYIICARCCRLFPVLYPSLLATEKYSYSHVVLADSISIFQIVDDDKCAHVTNTSASI